MKKPEKFFKRKKHVSDSQKTFFREIDIEYLIHELKDPISIIENNMLVLLNKKEKYGSLSDGQKKIVKRTLRNSQKTRNMLIGLLEIGRSQAGHFESCQFLPVHSVYQALIDSLETMTDTAIDESIEDGGKEEIDKLLADQGIYLDISADVMIAEIYQDEIKFRQIVGNLIKNAIHHRKKQVKIEMIQDEELLSVSVSDDGPGIKPKHQEMIFQRYAQVKKDSITARNGHGLGLAGSRILARRLGGDVDVISQKGEGATFRFTLPLNLDS